MLNFWRPGPPRKELNCRRRGLLGFPMALLDTRPITPSNMFVIVAMIMWDRFGLREDGILGAYLLLFWPAVTMRRFVWGRGGAECLALHRFGLALARDGRRRSTKRKNRFHKHIFFTYLLTFLQLPSFHAHPKTGQLHPPGGSRKGQRNPRQDRARFQPGEADPRPRGQAQHPGGIPKEGEGPRDPGAHRPIGRGR